LAAVGLTRRDLGHDEQIVVEVRSHRGALVAPFACLIACAAGAAAVLVYAHALPPFGRRVVGVAILVIGAVVLLAAWLRWRGRTITLTTQRVVVKVGRLGRVTEQVRLARIVEVHRIQGIADRIFGRGSLVLEVDDGPGLVIDRLKRPEALQRVIVRQLEGGEPASDGFSVERDRHHEEAGAEDRWLRYRSRQIQIVTEGDPTPPSGTPAVSGSQAATLFARLDELERLESSGALSPEEATRRRRQLTEPI
jgi:membrane protein YdbS with pleckstrin-like domain